MADYLIKTERALDFYSKEKGLTYYDSFYQNNSNWKVFCDAFGNKYFFCASNHKKGHKAKFPTYGKLTIEGRKESLCVGIDNVFISLIAETDNLESNLHKTIYPQEKLKELIAKRTIDETEGELLYKKNFAECVNSSAIKVAETYNVEPKEILNIAIQSQIISKDQKHEDLKIACETVLEQISAEEKEDGENEKE